MAPQSQLTSPGVVNSFRNSIPAQAMPPEFSKPELLPQVPPGAIDAWLAGCFIYTVFSSVICEVRLYLVDSQEAFTEKQQLKQVQLIPQSLRTEYTKLLTAHPGRRSTVFLPFPFTPHHRPNLSCRQTISRKTPWSKPVYFWRKSMSVMARIKSDFLLTLPPV